MYDSWLAYMLTNCAQISGFFILRRMVPFPVRSTIPNK
jgi:hypothetical protein